MEKYQVRFKIDYTMYVVNNNFPDKRPDYELFRDSSSPKYFNDRQEAFNCVKKLRVRKELGEAKFYLDEVQKDE